MTNPLRVIYDMCQGTQSRLLKRGPYVIKSKWIDPLFLNIHEVSITYCLHQNND